MVVDVEVTADWKEAANANTRGCALTVDGSKERSERPSRPVARERPEWKQVKNSRSNSTFERTDVGLAMCETVGDAQLQL